MPLPKLRTFGRRKSGGNSIDESPVAPTGFRVIPRDEANRRSVGGPKATLSQPDYLPARQNSYEDDTKSSNRGSNSTGASSHSRIFEGANTRLSSSSTLQSPLDAAKKDSPFFSARSQSPAYLNLPQDMEFQDEFGDMFSGLDKSNNLSTPPAPAVLRSESEAIRLSRTPSPFALAKVGNAQESYNSRDRSIQNPQMPPVPPPHQNLTLRKPVAIKNKTSIESFSRSATTTKQDADALMVQESFRAHRASVVPNTKTLKEESPLSSKSSLETEEQKNEEDEPLFANTESSKADALLALNLSESRNNSTSRPDDEPKKIYTAAQFKLLKKHEMSGVEMVAEAEGDNYDDDEDDEATRAQKRRLQEHKDAQHKIWRQRMSKAIGDHSTMHAGFHSSPNLLLTPTSEASSDDDEDIPLGVLQAHGFPSKNKPPDARYSANSFVGVVTTRPGSTVPMPRPNSPSRSVVAGGGPRGSLPPFARKLPQDPYFGASDLVNPANRESMGFNNSQRPSSVYTPAGAPPPPNMPNGLVGVIAEEERQRSMRRGSPNQPALRQSTYIPPQMGLPGMPINPAMLQMQGGGPEQQQMLNQQMVQLLQQQTLMIQHLMSQNQAFAGAPGTPQSRPMSMAAGAGAGAGSVRTPNGRAMSMVSLAPPMQSRTMSMINLQPHMGPAAFGIDSFMPPSQPNYAPSVAPSERSNVGQPSRYKPVVLADGASTITAVNTTTQQLPIIEKKRSFLSAIIHPSHKARVDDDDDDDWSNFAAKRRGQL